MAKKHPEQPGKIAAFLNNIELLQEIISQLEKDLGLQDFFVLHEPFDPEEFIDRISAVLQDLDKKKRLQSVLYLIDLPENTRWNDYNDLAWKILDREFKKVWFRKWHG